MWKYLNRVNIIFVGDSEVAKVQAHYSYNVIHDPFLQPFDLLLKNIPRIGDTVRINL